MHMKAPMKDAKAKYTSKICTCKVYVLNHFVSHCCKIGNNRETKSNSMNKKTEKLKYYINKCTTLQHVKHCKR